MRVGERCSDRRGKGQDAAARNGLTPESGMGKSSCRYTLRGERVIGKQSSAYLKNGTGRDTYLSAPFGI